MSILDNFLDKVSRLSLNCGHSGQYVHAEEKIGQNLASMDISIDKVSMLRREISTICLHGQKHRHDVYVGGTTVKLLLYRLML